MIHVRAKNKHLGTPLLSSSAVAGRLFKLQQNQEPVLGDFSDVKLVIKTRCLQSQAARLLRRKSQRSPSVFTVTMRCMD